MKKHLSFFLSSSISFLLLCSPIVHGEEQSHSSQETRTTTKPTQKDFQSLDLNALKQLKENLENGLRLVNYAIEKKEKIDQKKSSHSSLYESQAQDFQHKDLTPSKDLQTNEHKNNPSENLEEMIVAASNEPTEINNNSLEPSQKEAHHEPNTPSEKATYEANIAEDPTHKLPQDDSLAQLNVCLGLYNKGEFSEAERCFRLIAHAYNVHRYIIDCLRHQNKLLEAKQHFKTIYAQTPDRFKNITDYDAALILKSFGQVLYDSKDFANAGVVLQSVQAKFGSYLSPEEKNLLTEQIKQCETHTNTSSGKEEKAPVKEASSDKEEVVTD